MNPYRRLLLMLAMAAGLASTGVSFGQNLVVNPGFEEGPHNDAPPWGVGGWRGTLRATTTEKHSGHRSPLPKQRPHEYRSK